MYGPLEVHGLQAEANAKMMMSVNVTTNMVFLPMRSPRKPKNSCPIIAPIRAQEAIEEEAKLSQCATSSLALLPLPLALPV